MAEKSCVLDLNHDNKVDNQELRNFLKQAKDSRRRESILSCVKEEINNPQIRQSLKEEFENFFRNMGENKDDLGGILTSYQNLFPENINDILVLVSENYKNKLSSKIDTLSDKYKKEKGKPIKGFDKDKVLDNFTSIFKSIIKDDNIPAFVKERFISDCEKGLDEISQINVSKIDGIRSIREANSHGTESGKPDGYYLNMAINAQLSTSLEMKASLIQRCYMDQSIDVDGQDFHKPTVDAFLKTRDNLSEKYGVDMKDIFNERMDLEMDNRSIDEFVRLQIGKKLNLPQSVREKLKDPHHDINNLKPVDYDINGNVIDLREMVGEYTSMYRDFQKNQIDGYSIPKYEMRNGRGVLSNMADSIKDIDFIENKFESKLKSASLSDLVICIDGLCGLGPYVGDIISLKTDYKVLQYGIDADGLNVGGFMGSIAVIGDALGLTFGPAAMALNRLRKGEQFAKYIKIIKKIVETLSTRLPELIKDLSKMGEEVIQNIKSLFKKLEGIDIFKDFSNMFLSLADKMSPKALSVIEKSGEAAVKADIDEGKIVTLQDLSKMSIDEIKEGFGNRIEAAKSLLGKSLTDDQIICLIRAHCIGAGKTGNYSYFEKGHKLLELMNTVVKNTKEELLAKNPHLDGKEIEDLIGETVTVLKKDGTSAEGKIVGTDKRTGKFKVEIGEGKFSEEDARKLTDEGIAGGKDRLARKSDNFVEDAINGLGGGHRAGYDLADTITHLNHSGYSSINGIFSPGVLKINSTELNKFLDFDIGKVLSGNVPWEKGISTIEHYIGSINMDAFVEDPSRLLQLTQNIDHISGFISRYQDTLSLSLSPEVVGRIISSLRSSFDTVFSQLSSEDNIRKLLASAANDNMNWPEIFTEIKNSKNNLFKTLDSVSVNQTNNLREEMGIFQQIMHTPGRKVFDFADKLGFSEGIQSLSFLLRSGLFTDRALFDKVGKGEEILKRGHITRLKEEIAGIKKFFDSHKEDIYSSMHISGKVYEEMIGTLLVQIRIIDPYTQGELGKVVTDNFLKMYNEIKSFNNEISTEKAKFFSGETYASDSVDYAETFGKRVSSILRRDRQKIITAEDNIEGFKPQRQFTRRNGPRPEGDIFGVPYIDSVGRPMDLQQAFDFTKNIGKNIHKETFLKDGVLESSNLNAFDKRINDFYKFCESVSDRIENKQQLLNFSREFSQTYTIFMEDLISIRNSYTDPSQEAMRKTFNNLIDVYQSKYSQLMEKMEKRYRYLSD